MLYNEGIDVTSKSVEEDLPKLSAIGSKDDMSVAFVYDTNSLTSNVSRLIQYQLQLVIDSIHQIDKKIKRLKEKSKSLETVSHQEEKSKIEATYAMQDIERAYAERQKLLLRFDVLEKQLSLSITSNLNDKING